MPKSETIIRVFKPEVTPTTYLKNLVAEVNEQLIDTHTKDINYELTKALFEAEAYLKTLQKDQ